MTYQKKAILQQLMSTLKQARLAKKLSQRALSDKVGIPQSHLSKIESGHVDIQLTSFIQMARTLGLEVMLVPRQEISLVKNLIVFKEGARHDKNIKSAYTLDDNEDNHD